MFHRVERFGALHKFVLTMATIIEDIIKEQNSANYGNIGRGGNSSFFKWLQDILKGKSGKSDNDQEQDILSYLQSLMVNSPNMNDDQRNDWNKQILDQIINYQLTSENRQYNESLRDEQRLYDSPTNMLARLMGAGISRDAAIQMLSGSSGAGGAAAPYSDPAAAAQGIAPSQSRLNGVQADTAIANAVFGGIGSLVGLTNLGLSIPQAIHQTSILGAQSVMSQKALIGLQAADTVLSGLENAVSIGAISQEDMDGFSNATDALNYIRDHQDTEAFKSLFQNGSFQQVYGTKNGREMFANAWDTVRQSKDAGTLLDNHLRQTELLTELKGLETASARRNYYVQLTTTLNDLIKNDLEVQKMWQDITSGNYEIKILGETYKQAKMATGYEKANYDAFQNFLENGEPAEPTANSTGRDILNYMTFGNYYQRLQNMLVTTSNKSYTTIDPKKPVGSSSRFQTHVPREDYANYLRNNQDLLYTGVLVQQLVQTGRLNGIQNAPSVFQFFDLWRYSGASEMVNATTQTASDIAVPLILHKKP